MTGERRQMGAGNRITRKKSKAHLMFGTSLTGGRKHAADLDGGPRDER